MRKNPPKFVLALSILSGYITILLIMIVVGPYF